MKRQGSKEVVDRLAAVAQMAAMTLLIGSVEKMKRESVPPPSDSTLRASSKVRSRKSSTERWQ